MNNYDGPAYYRWRKDLKAVQRERQQNNQPQREAKAQSTSRGSRSLADSVAPTKKTVNKQPKPLTESKFSKQIRKFEPKKRPAIEEPNAQMVHFFDRQSNQRAQFYGRLIDNLRIQPDDLILFGNLSDFEEQEKREAVQANAEESVNEVQEQDEPTESKVTINSSTEPIEKNRMVEDEESSKDVDIIDSKPDSSNGPVEDDSDFEPKIQEQDDLEELPTGGLGKSFSTIMGGEATDTKLPFFGEHSDEVPEDVPDLSNSQTEIDGPQSAESTEPELRESDKVTEKSGNDATTHQEQQINQRFQNPVQDSSATPNELKSNDEADGTEERVELIDDDNATQVVDPVDNFNPAEYQFPSMKLLTPPVDTDDDQILDWIENQIDVLDKTLAAFGVDAKVVDWTNGPTVTQFQIKLALGVKVQRIVNLRDDLKLALAAKDVRIEAPIPGKSTVGIEIPNKNPRPVMLSEIIDTPKFAEKKSPLTTAVGVDISGRPQVTDIRKMPHGLIAGATGSGKSVFINSLLVSILYKANPAEVKLLLIDPKAVELAPYDEIPHLLSPVISDPQEAAAALKWVTKEMDERYEKLSAAGVRNIEQFNDKAEEREEYGLKMPYILVIIDELADLMMVASSEIQDYIVRITQKARAAGIHLIVATQRPSVDIVTGTIKNNIPTRIAFMVSSQVDSRTIIDTGGAESLLGKGDMLYLGNGAPQPIRLQGAYVTNEELENVVDFVKQQGKPKYLFTPDSLKQVVESHNEDELMPEVLKYISNEDTISTSKLQRLFSIGYNRAANIIDALERHHYISEQHGSKPREVYYHEEKN
ncbi:FtsK SpoIIIE family protein [Lentilactobacillus senioris DSM 24302 = JCM 17472]|uniref:DNA translocase FtsK n=1 Tax=Lentilactobacillus senioris DSM 24302 = JCM 17472 TaxID=1423802 RepID=A0A0R2CRI4_9LACO|nr:DNA translocase FtsK [Lentilactobacillus senioris]KRM93957.1 FtsK SpoIIIE family protein [Lentilactobacillus senioris DSM 24302 = JCM 17472]